MAEAKKKNIAIMIHSLTGGGAERIAGYLSKYLSSDYNVFLFMKKTACNIYDYGGTIVDLGMMECSYEQNLIECKRKYKIDVCISFLEEANFSNIRTRQNERVVISDRCAQSPIEPYESAEEIQIKRYYPYADEIVACSYGVAYDLKRNYQIPNEIRTIYNFIDKETICKKAEEPLPPNVESFLGGHDYFLAVGRLHRQKNHLRIIKQFEIYFKIKKDMKLVILGDGELKGELEEYIYSSPVKNHVIIIGYEKNPFRYMARAKAILLGSHYEGLPNVILEGMALGKPVIATDCLAGPREIIMGEKDYGKCLSQINVCDRGILVADVMTDNTGETGLMAEAMQQLCNDDHLEKNISSNAKKYMAKYSNEQILKQWVNLIEERSFNKFDVLGYERYMLEKAQCVILYGAGFFAHNTYLAMRDKYSFDYVAVTEKAKGFFYDVPIKKIDDLQNLANKSVVIIGVGSDYQSEIVNKLNSLGFKNIVFPFIDKFRYKEK